MLDGAELGLAWGLESLVNRISSEGVSRDAGYDEEQALGLMITMVRVVLRDQVSQSMIILFWVCRACEGRAYSLLPLLEPPTGRSVSPESLLIVKPK